MEKPFKPLGNIMPALLFSGLLLFIAYVPFIDAAMLSLQGDERFYLAQALEMLKNNHWFVQIYADQVNFYKGPLYYLFLLLGFHTFDLRFVSIFYMNVVFAFATIYAVILLCRPLSLNAAARLLIPIGLVSSFGLFGFTFSSQMEMGLCFCYALAMYFIYYYRTMGLWFWITAGIAGLLKSPLHSVLLGISYFSFISLSGTLVIQTRTVKFYRDACLGILVCILGYAPLYLLESDVFVKTFIFREMFNRLTHANSWINLVAPPFLTFLFPWTLFALLTYTKGFALVFKNIRAVMLPTHWKVEWKLIVSMFWPSLFFFLAFGHNAYWYAFPLLPTVWLMIGVIWSSVTAAEFYFYLKVNGTFLGSLFLLVGLALLGCLFWLPNLPSNIDKMDLLPSAIIFAIVGLSFFALYGMRPHVQLLFHALLAAFIIVGIGLFSNSLANRELRSIAAMLQSHGLANAAAHSSAPMVFYNPTRSIRTDWGFLAVGLRRPVVHETDSEKLVTQFQRCSPVVVESEDFESIKSTLEQHQITSWNLSEGRRWKKKILLRNIDVTTLTNGNSVFWDQFDRKLYMLSSHNTPCSSSDDVTSNF